LRFFRTTVLLGREELCGARSAAISAKLVAVYEAVSTDGDDVHEFGYLVWKERHGGASGLNPLLRKTTGQNCKLSL
jgi:hypothetical protein